MKKKFLILSLIIVLILPFVTMTSMAATSYSYTVSMTANHSKVTAGGEVLITVKLSNLNVGETGINSFSAYLSYDTKVFETLTDSSVDGNNSWVPSYTPGTGKITLYRPTSLKTDEEIMQISLKTKADLVDGTQGEVKLSTIIVSNSSDEIMASPVSTSITIGSSTDPVGIAPTNVAPANITPIPVNRALPNNNTPTNVTPTNSTPIVPVNNTPTNTPVLNNTTNTPNVNYNTNVNNQALNQNRVDGDMPYTGTDSSALARIIIGVIFIGLVMYIKIERLNKDIR